MNDLTDFIQAESESLRFDQPPTTAGENGRLRSHLWKISRETFNAHTVSVREAAKELQRDLCQVMSALEGGAVLENHTHFFSATLEGFIVARNRSMRRAS